MWRFKRERPGIGPLVLFSMTAPECDLRGGSGEPPRTIRK
jgi:hypothetical protein